MQGMEVADVVEQTILPQQNDNIQFKMDDVADQNCPLKFCNKVPCNIPWHKPCRCSNPRVIKRIWPMVLLVGVMELSFGIILVVFLLLFCNDYDKMFGTQQSRLISQSTFAGLFALTLSGLMLLVALLRDQQRMMLFHIMISTGLGVYIFILSVMKIHFALCGAEADSYLIASQNTYLLSTACVIGILTLLGSVIHFTGNVAVFTYYNMRFIHPVIFGHGVSSKAYL